MAAAGLATAFAVERVLVRKSLNAPGDPYAEEEFGDQPFDEELTVTAADGTDLHVEIVEPKAAGDKPTIVFVHGFALDMGTFYFQRQALAEQGEHRLVFYDQPGHGRSSRLQVRRLRHRRARQVAAPRCSTRPCRTGTSSWSGTRWAA